MSKLRVIGELARKKKPATVRKKKVDKDFRPHPVDKRYMTLTVPLNPTDEDEIRRFLAKTSDLWPKPYETYVAARLIEAVVLKVLPSEFIGAPSIYSPTTVFSCRGTSKVGFWVPNPLADRIVAYKKSQPRLRQLTDTDAVALLLVEAVARYIRPVAEPVIYESAPVEIADNEKDMKILSLTRQLDRFQTLLQAKPAGSMPATSVNVNKELSQVSRERDNLKNDKLALQRTVEELQKELDVARQYLRHPEVMPVLQRLGVRFR